jgi:hypothetical protein
MARLFLLAMLESSFDIHPTTGHGKRDPLPQELLDRLATMSVAAPLVHDFCGQGQHGWPHGLARKVSNHVELGLQDLPAAKRHGSLLQDLKHWLGE